MYYNFWIFLRSTRKKYRHVISSNYFRVKVFSVFWFVLCIFRPKLRHSLKGVTTLCSSIGIILPKQYTKVSLDDIACNIRVDYVYLLHKRLLIQPRILFTSYITRRASFVFSRKGGIKVNSF